MTDLIGRVLGAGRYRIDSELGGGGQAVVFRGTHLSLDMPVAIKILSFGAAGDHAAQVRFQREAQRAAALRHPNIVTIYDYAFEDGMYYIVSDFIDGADLQKLLETKPGPMSLEQVLAYVRQVGEALDYAHRQNIVHRDIKPANILIDSRDGRAVLVDFGLARMMEDEELTVTSARGGTPGTPAYMSPEQIMGLELDQGTDIYSLGVVVYEMVTGRNPFRGEHDTTASILYKHVHETPSPPRSVVPSLHPHIEAALLKVLAKDPKKRYRSAGAFVKDLEQAQRRMQTAPAAKAPSPRIRCPRCGASLPAGTRFCGACGAPTAPEARPVNARPAPRRQPAAPPASSRAGTPPPPSRTAARTARPAEPRAAPRPSPTAGHVSRPAPARVQPPAAAPVPFEYKGVGARLAAAVIDSILVFVPVALLYFKMLEEIFAGFESEEYAVIAEAALLILPAFAYCVLFEGWFGGTLGKLILGMRVVKKDGTRAGIGRALLRNLLGILDFLPVAYLLGIIMVAASSTKQGLGDRIAGTHVVARKSLPRR